MLPDAEPPDMASVDSPPLDELRVAAAQARDGSPWLAALSPFDDEMQAMAKKAVEARLRIEARWPEVVAGVLLRDRLRNALVSGDELEWIVPRSYGWEVAGQAGQVYGIPVRVVEGVDHLYLALKVTP